MGIEHTRCVVDGKCSCDYAPWPGDVLLIKGQKVLVNAFRLGSLLGLGSGDSYSHVVLIVDPGTGFHAHPEDGVSFIPLSSLNLEASGYLVLRSPDARRFEPGANVLQENCREHFGSLYDFERIIVRGSGVTELAEFPAHICTTLVLDILEDVGLIGEPSTSIEKLLTPPSLQEYLMVEERWLEIEGKTYHEIGQPFADYAVNARLDFVNVSMLRLLNRTRNYRFHRISSFQKAIGMRDIFMFRKEHSSDVIDSLLVLLEGVQAETLDYDTTAVDSKVAQVAMYQLGVLAERDAEIRVVQISQTAELIAKYVESTLGIDCGDKSNIDDELSIRDWLVKTYQAWADVAIAFGVTYEDMHDVIPAWFRSVDTCALELEQSGRNFPEVARALRAIKLIVEILEIARRGHFEILELSLADPSKFFVSMSHSQRDILEADGLS